MRNTIAHNELLPKYSFHPYSATAHYAHPCHTICKPAFNINPMCKNPRFLYISSTTCAKNSVFCTLDAFYALGYTSSPPTLPKHVHGRYCHPRFPVAGFSAGNDLSSRLPTLPSPPKTTAAIVLGGLLSESSPFLIVSLEDRGEKGSVMECLTRARFNARFADTQCE